MKKTLITLSFVCAGALAFADKEQFNSSWFSGIGTGATSIEALGASNGTWSGLTADNASVADGALVLDLDDGVAEATFAVTDTASAKAPGTLPAQGIVVRGVFTPIAEEDLLTGKAMAAKNAKVGFAIVNVGSETDTYKYYAWVGGGSTAEQESAPAVSDWVDLGAASDVTTAKTIVIDLEYESESVTAAFAVGAGNLENLEEATPLTNDDGLPLTGSARSKALADKVIASVSCTGSGTLKELKGLYQYAVAEAEGRKFGTADEAIAAAQATGGSGNVILRKVVNGEVSFSGYLCVHYDSGVSGLSESIKTSFKAAEGSAQTKNTTGGSSLLENGAYKEWSLTDDLLLAVKINGKVIGGGTWPESATSADSDFRKFLLNNCEIYRSSSATSEQIQSALLDKGSNGYPLWQSFVMGVDANESVKLAPTKTDTESEAISLTLAKKIPESPYGSSLKYTITKNGGAAGTATAIKRTSPVVKIPLETGRYSVKFTIGE